MRSDPDDQDLDALRREPSEVDPTSDPDGYLAARIGAAARARGELVEPPADLWDRIQAEVRDAEPAPRPIATVHHLRRRRPLLALAAAAVVVFMGAAVGVILLASGGADDPAPLAVATLDPLVDGIAAGSATLVDDDGLRLELTTTDLDAGDGFLELWLLDPEISQLVSLGEYRGPGTYPVPEGVDPDVVPVVDISIEPRDGDPTHSGNSLVRAALEDTA